jgi:hypothetical protein
MRTKLLSLLLLPSLFNVFVKYGSLQGVGLSTVRTSHAHPASREHLTLLGSMLEVSTQATTAERVCTWQGDWPCHITAFIQADRASHLLKM